MDKWKINALFPSFSSNHPVSWSIYVRSEVLFKSSLWPCTTIFFAPRKKNGYIDIRNFFAPDWSSELVNVDQDY